ncbi:hypothetical protein J7E96_19375 [Streptomyces sp. ISL-96]|uniref:hypothetical protein n=1 Tax=Streptomyces sp. ISL-96 TaxID=2819191 RepID=UPI001BE71BCB|nr:hypothetical protein [Streptomyces sp. ISL-96]MBT2490636.1 hypothetical protein [Streptomyces sp. ISL-96]
MTGPHKPRPAPPPAVLSITITSSTPTETWCTACKAYTRLTGTLLALTPDGVSTLGPWTWCDICDDPTDPTGPNGRPAHG